MKQPGERTSLVGLNILFKYFIVMRISAVGQIQSIPKAHLLLLPARKYILRHNHLM